jgi:Integrase core domain
MEENRVLREQLKGQRLRVNDLCLLKTRPPRLSCGLRTDPLLARHGHMALDRPWDTSVRGAHAPRIGTRKPCASAATRRVEGAPAAAATDADGPNLLGCATATVGELASLCAGGAAGDRGRLAQAGIPTLLDVEGSTATRSARDQYGCERSDSADEPGQSSLGRTKNPWRTPEARRNGIASDGVEVHAPSPAAAVAGVAHVFEESRHGAHRVGFLHGTDGDFRVLFVLVMLIPSRRRLVHFNVTEHPTAEWTARQLLEACAPEESPRYLIRDRDSVYGERFSRQARMHDIREVVIAPRGPWQNAYAERVIGSIRRECLDHVVVIGERHRRAILTKYVDYYNGSRTHLSLAKDAPEPRTVQRPSEGRVVAMPRVGGLHHPRGRTRPAEG